MEHLSSSAQLERTAETEPTEPPRRRGLGRWLAHLLALCVGVVGLVCALSLPFAPVWVDRTEVHWPGAQAETTTALFAPYRPAAFEASVPCPVLRNALERPGRTTVLTTLPPGSDREGLVLTTEDGEPRLLLGQQQVQLPPNACRLDISADSQRSLVTVDGRAPIVLPGVAAPEIFTFATDLDPGQLAGISVTARTFSWFNTSPTEDKTALITTALALALVSLVLLLVHAPPALRSVRVALTPLPVDAGVAAVLAAWLVIGPLTDDDGFAMMTVRNYDDAGDIGNYYRWFNASETPFTLVQHLMRWWSADDLTPVWLRVPSAVAGLLTWFVVSRGIVAPVCRGTRRFPLHLVTAVFFLACWLPFGLGIRPEPFLALGTSALVAALLKLGRTRAPQLWLGIAALMAGLTVAITPTGISALIIVLVFAPRIWRVLAQPGALPRWVLVPTRAALAACLAGTGLVAMFADSSWRGVMAATEIHDEFGPSLGWYQEIDRYAALLGTSIWGTSAKRLAVFLVITAALLAGACAMRQIHRWTSVGELPVLLGAAVAVLAALWLTPSKWTHHFGSLAGVGSALLAVVVVVLVRVGRLQHAKREARLLGVFGAVAASLAAALAFMGPNIWPMHSDFAVPWSDSPVRPDVPLDSPAFWLGGAVLIGLLALGLLRLRTAVWSRPRNRLMWTIMPASVLSGAALASVLVLLGSLAAAPQVMGDRFSVARMNWQGLQSGTCGLEDEVQALPVAEQLWPLVGEAELDGFTAGGAPPQEADVTNAGSGEPLQVVPPETEPEKGPRDEVQAASASEHSWTSRTGGPQNTGTLISPWFGMPQLTNDQALSLWIAGRPEQGNSLALEFAAADRSLGVRELRDPPPTDPPFDDPRHGRPVDWRNFRDWRLHTIDARDVPRGADRVRILGEDRTSDEQGWLSVSGPVVRDVVPLRQALDARGPVLIDWTMSFLFPCRGDYPQVAGGVASSPRLMVTPPTGDWGMAVDPNWGGVFAGATMLSRRIEIPTRLRGAPGHAWGHLYAVGYGIDRDAYTTTRTRETIGGAHGDPPYPFKEH
ncbi:arabinosyltransferase C [Saccharopolyspora antimicrobica]|uniref:Arabinosyltransferase C n=1 Tax=Saccharopolyspora antimicrobica TaxID=455193 RepID=A0A1I4X191_9PSEU|nr:arabinosyltransferase domain-containing protein [Saccharopolyspora antimicrobica]RKT84237.1 arabinosyltransferase C [Saccharopolyspora antimicrobica]SFN19146.1 arabinosyltransferase C [Saccharopolyspora antimicrobica]